LGSFFDIIFFVISVEPKKTNFLKKYQLYLYFIGAGFFLFLGIQVWMAWLAGKDLDIEIAKENSIIKNQPPPKPKFEMPLSGVKVFEESLTKKTPLAVVIENSPNARMQSGLDRADMVYETTAEGGITRFLAFFQQHRLNEIGPVRSARTYFVNWIVPYSPFFVHIGGSEAAYSLIRQYKRIGIDDLRGANVFWRDKSRYAPHNAYTSYERVKNFVAGKYPLETDGNFSNRFKDEASEDLRPEAQVLTVRFSSVEAYNVVWRYNKDNNSYKREMLGVPHTDRVTGNQLEAKNLVVLETTQTSTNTTEQHVKKTIGSGKATYFLDGKQISGYWKKTDVYSPIKFYDEYDREIEFNRGQLWVMIITQFGSFLVN